MSKFIFIEISNGVKVPKPMDFGEIQDHLESESRTGRVNFYFPHPSADLAHVIQFDQRYDPSGPASHRLRKFLYLYKTKEEAEYCARCLFGGKEIANKFNDF